MSKQIHNKIEQLNRFDLGTQPKVSWPNFLVDLKKQTTYCEKIRPGLGYYKIFEIKNCLNMSSKLDKEGRSCDDIAFIFEIIVDFRFW